MGCVDPARIAVLVLAAGRASRMGTSKQLLDLGGVPLLLRTINIFIEAGLRRITVVLGHEYERVGQVLAGCPVDVIVNRNYERGVGSSISTGISSLAGDVEAVLIMPGDLPLVLPSTVKKVVQTHFRTGSPIVIPVYDARRGHPVLFHRSLFEELAQLNADWGGKEIVRKNSHLLELVEVDDPGILMDVDSWEDYCRAVEYMRGRKRQEIVSGRQED